MLLVLAVVLTAVATFAALRAETRSQDQSAAPKLDSTLTLTSTNRGGTYDLTVTAIDAHLPGSNTVEVTVYGLPQTKRPPVGSVVGPAPRLATETAIDPPSCAKHDWCSPPRCQITGCRMIANSFYGPDTQGSLNAQLNVLFPEKSYSSLHVIARRFSPSDKCKNGTESQCYTETTLVISPR